MIYARVTNEFAESYLKVTKLYCNEKTKYQEVAIAEIQKLGKTLLIDNKIQTCEKEVKAYHDALILNHELPIKERRKQKALILGAGEGVSVLKLVNAGYEVTAIDIDEECIELISKYLRDWNNNIYAERNKSFTLLFKCAYEHLKSLPDESIEYLVFDLTEPSSEASGASNIAYQEDFIKECYRVLKTRGVFSYQDGSKFEESILTPHVLKYFKINPLHVYTRDWQFSHIEKLDPKKQEAWLKQKFKSSDS